MRGSALTPPERELKNLAGGFAGVTAASIVGNVFPYALLVSSARYLPARDYSAFVAMMNVLLVGSVPAFALQAVAARRVAIGQTRDLIRVSTGLSVGVGVLFAVICPLEIAFLRLPGASAPLLLAASIPGVALQGMCQGCWQGEQRFRALALTTAAGLVGRSGAALIGLFIGRSASSAMLGLFIGTTATALLCVWRLPDLSGSGPASTSDALSTPKPTPPGPGMASARPWALVIECAHASHAYGVFLLLTVTDVLLASHVLPTTAAAVYAAGSVVTKGTLWLPQSLASVLFASMTDADRHRGLFLRGAGAIATLGVIVTIGCWLLGPMVTFIVAGAKYPQLHSDLYLFAMLGSCLALTQFALVTGLAIRSRRVTTLVWASIATEALFVLVLNRDGGVRGIVTAVATINLVAAGLAVVLRVAAPRISGRRRPSSARTQCSLPSEH